MTERSVDPTGKRALFSVPVDTATERAGRQSDEPREPHEPHGDGRTALFSTPPRRPGTVIVECSDCKVRSRVSLTGLAMRLATGSAWIPLGRYQHWVRCPACGQRHRCRIGWLE